MLKLKGLSKIQFSKAQLAAFVLVFSCIGGYFLLQSHAAGSTANVFVSANGSDTGSNCVRFAAAQANPDPTGATLCASFDKAYKLALTGDNVEVEAGNYPKQSIYGNAPKTIADGSCAITPTSQSTQNCITFMPAPNTTPAIAGLTIMAPGVRLLNLDFKDGGIGVAWLDNPSGTACKNVPQPHDIILDSAHVYISAPPTPGTAKGSLSASGVYNIAIVNSDIGPFYDSPGTGQFSNLTQASSSYCSAYSAEQLKDRNIYLFNNKWHDLYQTVMSNGANCGSDPAQYFCNHMECIHWRASNSWIVNNKFLNCAQNDVSVQTFGANVPNIDNLQIIGNVFDKPCSNQAPPCGVVSALPIICSSVGDTVTNTIVAYNSIMGDAGFQKDSCTSSSTFAGSVVMGNLMQAAASTSSCSTKINVGVSFAYNVWDHTSTSVCDPTDHILSGNMPWTDAGPPNYDFSLAGGAEIASFVPEAVNIAGKTINCPARDIANNSRPAAGNSLCAAGAYEFVPIANVWVSTTGNDATCVRGDQTKPCATADKAASLAQAGDIVEVGAGNYEHFKLTGHCFTNWVTFQPAADQAVVIDGGSGGADDFAGAFELAGNGAGNCYIRIQEFEMTDRIFIDLTAHNIDVSNNYIHSKATSPDVNSGSVNVTVSGVATRCTGTCAGQSDITIENNHFNNIAYNCLGTGNDLNACDTADNSPVGYGYCIPTGSSITNLVIKNNWLDGCWEDGIQTALGTGTQLIQDNRFNEIGGGATTHSDGIQIFTPLTLTNAVIQRNVWSGTHSTCIRIQNGERDNFIIQNNVCGTSTAGRCMDLEDFHNSTVSFNTCGPTQFGFTLEDDTAVPGVPDSDIIENNIFEDASGACAIDISGTNITYRYNIVTDPCSVGGAAMSNCSAGCLTTHPIFVNATNGADLRLAAGSAGIDAGIAEAGVSLDAGNQPRPVDIATVANTGAGAQAFYDIGAYEYVSGASAVPGDLNNDSHVNVMDLSIMLSHYGQAATAGQGDINSSGTCDITDLSILLSHYGT